MEENLICALLIGEADTEKKAKQIAKTYKNCPYINLMATNKNQLFATFFLPERQQWWIMDIEKTPRETFRLEKAKVIFPDEIQYPKELKMRIPEKPQEISPCGANCKACSTYENCSCCPATIFFKHLHHNKES